MTDSCTLKPSGVEGSVILNSHAAASNQHSAGSPHSGDNLPAGHDLPTGQNPPAGETLGSEADLTDWLASFTPPPFQSHRLLRGGHLHTLIGAKKASTVQAIATTHQRHRIDLPDGDALVVHDNQPENWRPENGSVLMIHGICGCHSADYMIRFKRRLASSGIRTFRLDMRGCGDAGDLCQTITHAGRSEDVLTAIEFVGDLVDNASSPIGAVGVSLGGNQLLLAAGRVGNGFHQRPKAWSRVGPILAIAPPLDLQACSDAMQSPKLRFYNWYFIHHLLRRASPALRQNPQYQAALEQARPKKLRQFDRIFTAPLGGFESESDYYHRSSAVNVIQDIQKPTLIVTAANDPLVPVSSFGPVRQAIESHASTSPVRLHVTAQGGHHGFLKTDRTSWADDLVASYFDAGFASS